MNKDYGIFAGNTERKPEAQTEAGCRDSRRHSAESSGAGCRKQCGMPDVRWIADWKRVCGQVLFRLVNTEQNTGMLEHMPHTDMPELGLSMVYYLLLDAGDGQHAAVHVQHSLMRAWKVSEAELRRQAGRNTPERMRIGLYRLVQAEAEGAGLETARMQETAAGSIRAYVLTNEQMLYGAAGMLYEGVLEHAAEEMRSGFYVLPSSVHEVILYSSEGTDRMELEGLKSMVAEINRSGLVDREDVLSDEVYYYDRMKRRLFSAGRTGTGGGEA